MIYAVRYLLIVLYTVVWGTVGTLLGLIDRSGERVVWVGRRWIAWILRTCGIRIDATGTENIDPRRSYIFMANHQSAVDIAAIVHSLPVSFRFVAKRELSWIPAFGWALALGGHVLIDRSKRPSAIRSLERAARRIRNGTNVIVFPEGTRSPDGSLRGFKAGGFHLAIDAQVPVLPVTVSGSRSITPKRSLRVEEGTVKIVYGKPIPTEGMNRDDRRRLMDEVRAAITAGYDPALHAQDLA